MRNSLGKFIKGHKKIGLCGAKKGTHNSPATEFQKGISCSPQTQFKKGLAPWNKNIKGLQTAWNKGKNSVISADKHPNWKGGLPECSDCSKQLSSYKSKRCIKCQGVFFRGEGNYRWIKDRTIVIEKRRIRGTQEWKNWRMEIFERDKYTCQECFRSGVILEPHHIEPIREVGLDSDKLFNTKNGITLCRPCHQKTIWKESNFVEKYSRLVEAH